MAWFVRADRSSRADCPRRELDLVAVEEIQVDVGIERRRGDGE
jgi:hypothetical protein